MLLSFAGPSFDQGRRVRLLEEQEDVPLALPARGAGPAGLTDGLQGPGPAADRGADRRAVHRLAEADPHAGLPHPCRDWSRHAFLSAAFAVRFALRPLSQSA